MNGYTDDIETLTHQNTHFRHVLYTSSKMQLVVMSLLPGEDIGLETHLNTDQFVRIEQGQGYVIMDGRRQNINDGDAMIIPAGTEHNIINASADQPLKLYTIYTPPEHKDGAIHRTKQEALADEHDRH
jgi:mannose-6-phosphate isomerase-like protein (cupin superfamily)